MSEIARELKMLFYLDSKYKHSNKYISRAELAEYLEISDRQVRRYRSDLEQAGYYIDNKSGPDGGYRLVNPLDKSLMIPDNIMLALSIAAKSNKTLLQSLNELPVVPKTEKRVDGDSFISDHELEVLTVISEAIKNKKRIHFDYDIYNKPTSIDVEPYKIIYAYHTYYLRGRSVFKNELRKYDIDKITNISITDPFEVDANITKQTDEELLVYGIFDSDKPNKVLHLKYHNKRDANIIDRYFECKGTVDAENMIYTVTIKDSAEAFYTILSLHNKIEILDKDIRFHFINYLKQYIKKMEE